jgi:hypothetical protein
VLALLEKETVRTDSVTEMLWLRLIVVALLSVGVLVRFRIRDNVSD